MRNFILSILSTATLTIHAQEATQLQAITVNPGLNKQGSASSIDADQLRTQMPNTLRDGVGNMPNVEFVGGPRNQAQSPQIRGLSADRILILEDGVRQNFHSGHNGRTFGDFSLLEDVEVVKGPWSSLYGSGAMGGAISFRRATAADMIRRSNQDRGVQVALDGASANDLFGQRITGFGKAGSFEPLISVRQSDSHDIRLGDGRKLDYSSSQTFDVYSALTYRVSQSQNFTLKLNRFEDRADTTLDPEMEVGPLNRAGQSQIIKQDAVGEYNLAGERWDFHAKPFHRQTQVKKQRLSDGRVDTQIVGTTGIDLWNNWRAKFENFETVVTFGSEYFEDRTDGRRNAQELASFPDGKGGQLGIYLQPTLSFGQASERGRLTLTPGLRYDAYEIKPETGRSNEAKNLSAKASADFEYRPRRHVFLGWGQAFNAPRMQDLYISGMHFPGNFFVANPDLKPERADTFEAGSKNDFTVGDNDVLTLNGTYFRTEARDFIARSVNFAGGTTQFQNMDRVRLEGFELSTLYQRGSWGAGLSYGQTRSLDKESGEPLTDTAADQWTGTFQLYPAENFSVGTALRVARKQDHVPTGTSQTPGYFTEDFFANYKTGRWDYRVRLDNAFDRDYRSHTSAIKSTGRDVRATVSYLF